MVFNIKMMGLYGKMVIFGVLWIYEIDEFDGWFGVSFVWLVNWIVG